MRVTQVSTSSPTLKVESPKCYRLERKVLIENNTRRSCEIQTAVRMKGEFRPRLESDASGERERERETKEKGFD
jgi:hypothetical protein